MSNHEIFMLPGHFLLEFILSVLGMSQGEISDSSTKLFTVFLAGLFWWQVVVIIIALVKKKFGFYQGGQQR